MRNDAAAKERRRQRARERQAAQEPVNGSEPKWPTPDKADEMLDFAVSLGWTYERRKNGYLLKHPCGQTATLHLTISDVAGWRNLRSQLLRPLRRDSTPD